jgi:hypothetical protein
MFRRVSVVLSVVALALAGACSSSYEEKDVFPAKPGLVVPDASGAAMAEAAACAALTDALGNARTRLSCADFNLPACPGSVRPPDGRRCAQYDQGSVDACVSIIDRYGSCDELASSRCIVTVLASSDPTCVDEPEDGGSEAGDADSAAASDAARDGGDAGDAGRDAAADAARDAPAG